MSRKKTTTHIDDECCIHEDVMKQIHNDKITMRPRLYFVAGSALVGAGMAGAVITSIFFTQLTLYKIRYDAAFEYLSFGRIGMQPFTASFPWIPFLVAVGGLIGGSHLLKQYEISYKHRYKRILIAFIALIITLGFLLDKLDVHRHMTRFEPLKALYGSAEEQPFIYGNVIQVYGTRAVIQTPYGKKVFIDTRYVPRGIRIKNGTTVRAIGEWDGSTFVIERIIVR